MTSIEIANETAFEMGAEPKVTTIMRYSWH